MARWYRSTQESDCTGRCLVQSGWSSTRSPSHVAISVSPMNISISPADWFVTLQGFESSKAYARKGLVTAGLARNGSEDCKVGGYYGCVYSKTFAFQSTQVVACSRHCVQREDSFLSTQSCLLVVEQVLLIGDQFTTSLTLILVSHKAQESQSSIHKSRHLTILERRQVSLPTL
jgi:hypothetical protein